MGVAADLVERFRADLERLTGAAPGGARPLGVAVSGGPDSLALLLLAHAAYPGHVIAATVDHELRPESAGEARGVATLCADLAVQHTVLRREPGDCYDGFANLQERARMLRYACLHGWAQACFAPFVATAHQQDDVAETFLMRAGRGVGLRGLAAMPSRRPIEGDRADVVLVRPLLAWSRETLAAIVAAAGLTAVVDPSNSDDRFDRARVRRLLASSDLPVARIARAAAHLRDAEDALDWVVRRELEQRFAKAQTDAGHGLWLEADDLPFELKRRFVEHAIARVRQEAGLVERWRATAVPRLVRSLDAGIGAMVADVQARVIGGRWHFRLAPPRRAIEKG